MKEPMKNILLLEDDESVNRGIAFSLEKEDYQVFPCKNIKEAQKAFKEIEMHLLICDVTLPDGSGLEFVRKVREKSDVHIICLTAMDQEIDMVMGYEAGADDYITKPFSLSVLCLKVSAYFRKYQGITQQKIQSGRICVLIKEMRLLIEEEEVSLTKNEWRMLQVFLEHPRQVLSKNQLLDQLFHSYGEFVDENTIAVNIRRLREKIEPNPSNPEYIRNIHGIGYVWDKECINL